jgi:hypothetical protein
MVQDRIGEQPREDQRESEDDEEGVEEPCDGADRTPER